MVTVLPVTHTPPSNPVLSVEIPHMTKQRLGLDVQRSWVILTEANRFIWPGPDVSMEIRGDPASVIYGELPGKLLLEIKDRFISAIKTGKAGLVQRTQ